MPGGVGMISRRASFIRPTAMSWTSSFFVGVLTGTVGPIIDRPVAGLAGKYDSLFGR
jgi:hypothetical protein